MKEVRKFEVIDGIVVNDKDGLREVLEAISDKKVAVFELENGYYIYISWKLEKAELEDLELDTTFVLKQRRTANAEFIMDQYGIGKNKGNKFIYYVERSDDTLCAIKVLDKVWGYGKYIEELVELCAIRKIKIDELPDYKWVDFKRRYL